MRVALVITKLAGLRGGAERIVVDLARELAERGHEVTLVTYEVAAAPPGYDPGDIAVVNLFPAPLRRAVERRSRDSSEVEAAVAGKANGRFAARVKWELVHGWYARRLARWLRRHPQNTVVGFLPSAISATAFAGARLGTDRPRVIASTHNVPDEDFGPDGRWDPNPVARRNNLRALEMADAVTVLQPEFIEQLPTGARSNAVVMPNPVRRLAPVIPGVERRNMILGVGRLTTVKRFDVLVRAFAELAEEFPDWCVEIYGDGPERGRLEQLVTELALHDRVRLAGITTELAPVYDAARMLVHPAVYEGFGLVVAEAILHGLDVVAFEDCPGANGLVEDGATGVLVEQPAEPAAAIVEGIRQLITEPPDPGVRDEARRRLAHRLAPGPIYDAWERLMTDDSHGEGRVRSVEEE
ncbi:MAG: glycosyltransferase [Ilumatobacter fluminis]|uniref:glycosyltransferase n=1 Tax=Ilumatobacter fluminis TaxID=467091 RepID=UPI0032EF82BD